MLNQLYRKAVIYPSIAAIGCTGIMAYVDNSDYKSEWLTKDSVVGMAMLVSLFYAIIVCVLSLPIFLVKKIKKERSVLIFFVWFLLPFSWMTISVTNTIYHRLTYESGTKAQLYYLVTLNLPFVIGLVWTFRMYKLDLKR